MEIKEFLTIEEAAELLQLHPETIRRLTTEGKIPGVKIGGVWRFRKSDIDGLFEHNGQKPKE